MGGEPGSSRIGPLIALPVVLAELGVAPLQAYSQAGISPGSFEDPDNRVPLATASRLLEVCAELSQRSDFGLLVGARCTLANFGALGELMRNAPSIGDALRMLLLHLHFYDRGAIPVMLSAQASSVFLGYQLQHPGLSGGSQLQDAAVAISSRILRELCGQAWTPQAVQFSHHQPDSRASYRRLFGSGVSFNAEWSGLYFDARWMELHIAGADPARYRQLHRALQRAESSWPISLAEEVQCLLHQQFPAGTVSAAGVARLFGYSERTLRQKLSDEGTSMRHLLAATRFELARHLLEDTELPISRIAEALCYADSAVLSRAFHAWTGVSPRQWRNANMTQ
jgi:AraC-like DNA-binding protein